MKTHYHSAASCIIGTHWHHWHVLTGKHYLSWTPFVAGRSLEAMATWRGFFSWPASDRLNAWRPDWNRVAIGVAIAGLLFLFPDATATTTNFDRLVAFVVFAAAVGVFWSGISSRVPTVEVEQAWNADYDKLRNMTDLFLIDAIRQFTELRGARTTTRQPWRVRWQDYIEHVPIPKVERGPLRVWYDRLANHPSDDVKQFFYFAAALGRIISAAEYRRFAVRTYDRFSRLHASNAPGFREWMKEEEVTAGAEGLVVLLAYMEVARAGDVPIGTSAAHLGFWSLAEEWHRHNTLRLLTNPTTSAERSYQGPAPAENVAS
jgi:hypothetical protein